jgi:hypothetical protein
MCYCKNCGVEYQWQASGNYNALDTPKEYQDRDYCPECKKAIVEALSKIEKKVVINYIETDEITLEELKKIEKEYYSNNPLSFMRVFATTYNNKLGESNITREVYFNNKVYIYSYYPSLINEAKITKKVRFEIKTNKILTDEFYE